MATITTEQLRRSPGVVRRAVLANEEIAVTFHSKPLARIVPDSQWVETQAELARLRALLAEHGLADSSQQPKGVAA